MRDNTTLTIKHSPRAKSTGVLTVVMYHYVRDLPRSPYPNIKGMLTDDFRHQVSDLSSRFEMATLDTALRFLAGEYSPRKDLCLLTFDDGLRDHYENVFPILAENRVSGLFFPITSCVEDHCVATVHKNHFLLATVDTPTYREAILRSASDDVRRKLADVDKDRLSGTYRWDTLEVAELKYLLNFCLARDVRDEIIDDLFRQQFGDESQFSRELYLTWDDARRMQADGMVMGGHSHRHDALANLTDQQQLDDLTRCARLLRERLSPQAAWPFSFPYGKRTTFNSHTLATLHQLEFCAALVTEVGHNTSGQDPFAIQRVDPKDI